jgi:hypothetical protein
MGWLRWGDRGQTSEQISEDEAIDGKFVAEHEASDDARYDSMTEAQRDKYFVHPGLFTRIKQFWTGV